MGAPPTYKNPIEKCWRLVDSGWQMAKIDIKRLLALYFGASMNSEQIGDFDGESALRNFEKSKKELFQY
jgi:hypothetical protein